MAIDFTRFYKDPQFGKTRHTMQAKKTMHGKRWKQKEIYLGPTRAQKFFRKTNVNVNRTYTFRVRNLEYAQGVRFKKRRLKGPVGVKFDSDSIMKSIYEKYGESSRERQSTIRSKTTSQKMSSSKLKRESAKTSIREEARRIRGPSRSRPRPPPVEEPIMREEPKSDVFWEEQSPLEVQPMTYRAQCYSCYGMMDVPYDDEPVIINCPSCNSKNMFREPPKQKPKKEEKVDTWFVDEAAKEDQVTWSGVNTKPVADEKAVSMNEYGKKLLDQGFYKAAIYWFDQAISQDPDYRAARDNRAQAQKMLDTQYNMEFKF